MHGDPVDDALDTISGKEIHALDGRLGGLGGRYQEGLTGPGEAEGLRQGRVEQRAGEVVNRLGVGHHRQIEPQLGHQSQQPPLALPAVSEIQHVRSPSGF